MNFRDIFLAFALITNFFFCTTCSASNFLGKGDDEMDLEFNVRNIVPNESLITLRDVSVSKGSIVNISHVEGAYLFDKNFHIKIHYENQEQQPTSSLYKHHLDGRVTDHIVIGNDKDYVVFLFHPVKEGWNFESKSFGQMACQAEPSLSDAYHNRLIYIK